MTVNEFIRKVKYDMMLSSLDIPLTVNGKEVVDMEFVFGDIDGNGSYEDISIDLRTEISYKEILELENTEFDYGHNVKHKINYEEQL